MPITNEQRLSRLRETELRRLPIPNEHRGKTLDDVRRHDGNTTALGYAAAWVEDAPGSYLRPYAPEAGKGLTFFGSPGTGKTLIASVIAQEMVRKSKRPGLVHFISMEGFNRRRLRKMEIGKMIGTDADDGSYAEEWGEHDRAIQHCYEVPLLILDDIGQENMTEHLARMLNELLRARYGDGYPTIITTNVDPDDWKDHFGSESLASFIWQAGDVVPVHGDDWRLA